MIDLRTFNPAAADLDTTKAAQQQLADLLFYPLALGIDGDFETGSKRALSAYQVAVDPAKGLADLLRTQIGVTELGDHGNDGPFVNLYQTSNGGVSGESWCADLVSWGVARWLAHNPNAPKLPPPNRRDAWGFTAWAETAAGVRVFRPGNPGFVPRRGDIVEYRFSHVGCNWDFDPSSNTLHDVEGNTNQDGSSDGFECILHPRYLSSVRALIRIPQIA